MKLGTEYGGWIVPTDMKLDVVYSGGVGEDISFDIKLQSKYDCNIILIDPTKKSSTHFEECKRYFNDKSFKFTGGIQDDYYSTIEKETPNFEKFIYIDKGLWNKKDVLKFYSQENENYVSKSLVDGMFTDKYENVNVDSVKNIMTELGHDHIDLLKIDIEGAEIEVLNQMLDDNIYPTYLCVEFDLYLKNKDPQEKTKKIIDRLMNIGYIVIANDNMNVTFKFSRE